MGLNTKKNNARFGRYPACDHLNYALYFLLKDDNCNKTAIEEVYYAIAKAGGYFYENVIAMMKEKGILSEDGRVNNG